MQRFDTQSRPLHARLARWVCLLCLVGLAPLGTALPTAAEDADSGVSFTLALAALRGEGLDGTWIQLTDDDSSAGGNALRAGDRVKMLVEVLRPCYVYILLLDADEQLALIFPSELPHRLGDAKPGVRHFIPPKDSWFQLDDSAGEETFYVLASEEPLESLEQAMASYAKAKSSADKEMQLETTLDLIAELQAKHAQHGTALRKPASIGGTVRGLTRALEITRHAESISSQRFFSATYTIRSRAE